MRLLAQTTFTEQAHNAVLVGGPGTGKTHLATAIGIAAVTRHGKRVRFYSSASTSMSRGASATPHCYTEARSG